MSSEWFYAGIGLRKSVKHTKGHLVVGRRGGSSLHRRKGEEDGVKGECHDVTVEGADRAVLKTDLLAIPSGGM